MGKTIQGKKGKAIDYLRKRKSTIDNCLKMQGKIINKIEVMLRN
jgi:hypothetical protein